MVVLNVLAYPAVTELVTCVVVLNVLAYPAVTALDINVDVLITPVLVTVVPLMLMPDPAVCTVTGTLPSNATPLMVVAVVNLLALCIVPTIVLVTCRFDNMPTEVILGCAAPVTVAAVPADVAGPLNALAVIALAAKLPLPSLATNVALLLLGVPSLVTCIMPVAVLTDM